jgi:hypothetical protein
MPACNKRFGARRGVRPQKVLPDFQAFAPARTFVKPRPVAKPPDVARKRGDSAAGREIANKNPDIKYFSIFEIQS